MIFNLNDWQTSNVGMHCRTLEQCNYFTAYLRKAGKTWWSGEQYKEGRVKSCFSQMNDPDGLVYLFNRGTYNSYSGTLRNNKSGETSDSILEFEDFEWPGYSCGYEESDVTLSEILGIGDCDEI